VIDPLRCIAKTRNTRGNLEVFCERYRVALRALKAAGFVDDFMTVVQRASCVIEKQPDALKIKSGSSDYSGGGNGILATDR
jgi:hypothetical protein